MLPPPWEDHHCSTVFQLQVHLTIEDFIERPWRGVLQEICHNADLSVHEISLWCFCMQSAWLCLLHQILSFFLKQCLNLLQNHSPITKCAYHFCAYQENCNMPVEWSKEPSGNFLGFSFRSSALADPQRADRACYLWPFYTSQQTGSAKATAWVGNSPSAQWC